ILIYGGQVSGNPSLKTNLGSTRSIRRKALMAAPEFQLATPSNWAIDSRVQKKIPVGKTWESRSDAMELHRRSMAGIYGTKELGAISIVTSGFYPGQDDGDVLSVHEFSPPNSD
ncbi:unnamed protein product, partial [Mycena citricolor]